MAHRESFQFHIPPAGQTLQVACFGTRELLLRPCVDCGLITGRFCDHCRAADRLPGEAWADGQRTPLCSHCDNKHDACHFCRGQLWCAPPQRR